jgi:hypothetical protein
MKMQGGKALLREGAVSFVTLQPDVISCNNEASVVFPPPVQSFNVVTGS